MRKFIFNGAIISAVIGLWTTIQSTKQGPRDWRVPLMWISAALSGSRSMPPKSSGLPQRRMGTRGITFSANALEFCAG